MAKAQKRDGAPEKPAEKKLTALEEVASFLASLVVVLFIITFVAQAFEIPTGSMIKTLLIGDHLFVDRISYAAEPSWDVLSPKHDVRRGDIIVFVKPGEPDMMLVKRVIGIPGDRLHLKDTRLYRNGEAVTEPFTIRSVGNFDPYRDDFPQSAPDQYTPITPEWRAMLPEHVQNGDLVVPPGMYFAMGDNRDVSLDSRYWGFVPRENIVGRPLIIYWSYETPSDQWEKRSAGERVGFAVTQVLHFFDRTRWSRMFRMPR